jgi:predicted AlkP superfamily pyrophosphatase or phosphodiesterase
MGEPHRTVVVDVPGLSADLLGDDTPHLSALAGDGRLRPLRSLLPAVLPTVHATLITGAPPRVHGCVGSGWYFRELAEVRLGPTSARLVGGEPVWEEGRRRDPAFTAAQVFWSHGMYSTADVAVAARPVPAGEPGAPFDLWTQPSPLGRELVRRQGAFPGARHWGPGAGIAAARWIAGAARYVYDTRRPTLTLVSLPYLDRELTRFGPGSREGGRAVREIDELCGELVEHLRRDGARVVLLSGFGIAPVGGAVHVNRALREADLLRVRDEPGTFDPGLSEAFAFADHQVAHVYVRRPERIAEVRRLLERLPGVDAVLDAGGKRAAGLDHPRSGELVAIARPDRWFTYYHWLEDDPPPPRARTVDPQKPGFDPAELLVDPAVRLPVLRFAASRLRAALGLPPRLALTPVDASLVRGSHGRAETDPRRGPLLISTEPGLLGAGAVAIADVKALLLDHVFEEAKPPGRRRRRGAA